MKYVFFCSIIIISLIFSTANIKAYSIDEISYSIRGDLDTLNFLELRVSSRLDHINASGISVIHDGNSLKFQGDWWINFLQRPEYRMSLKFIFPVEVENLKVGRGIGFYGEVFTKNNLYWEISHYFDKDIWVYEGGLLYQLNDDLKLLSGIGNTYWSSNNFNIHFGFGLKI